MVRMAYNTAYNHGGSSNSYVVALPRALIAGTPLGACLRKMGRLIGRND